MLGRLISRQKTEERSGAMSWPDYLRLWEQFGFNGVSYVVPGGNLGELTAMQAQRSPIVWACISVRLMVFSEVTFSFQQYVNGRPAHLWGNPDLQILANPWPQATTGDLLARMEVDASLYGNSYWVKNPAGDGLLRLDPTRVEIATAPVNDVETDDPFSHQLIGYVLTDERGRTVSVFLPDEVCHYKPVPDPAHPFRGASWLNALLPDVIADLDLTDYKHSFLRNAATPNLVVSFPEGTGQDAFNNFRDKMESAHTGPQSGFKTLYLGAGAQVHSVGSNFNDLAMVAVQSQGETRIAAAAGVPPSIVGLSEGLKGSALNSGNYTAGALATICPPPNGSRLWYDERDVSFLQEDVLDAANIREQDAKTALTLIQAGFTPDTAVIAAQSGDLSTLEHTGLVSVQLQKPGPALAPGGSEQIDPTLPDDPMPAPGV